MKKILISIKEETHEKLKKMKEEKKIGINAIIRNILEENIEDVITEAIKEEPKEQHKHSNPWNCDKCKKQTCSEYGGIMDQEGKGFCKECSNPVK